MTSEVLPAIRQTGRYCGYSANDPDPVVVWAKLLGVRTSDVITKGFGVGYLLGGPIHPSDYLAHNHRVLCHAVRGLASCWPGLHQFDYDPRWSRREWSAKEFAFNLQIADWLANRFLEADRARPAAVHLVTTDGSRCAEGLPIEPGPRRTRRRRSALLRRRRCFPFAPRAAKPLVRLFQTGGSCSWPLPRPAKPSTPA